MGKAKYEQGQKVIMNLKNGKVFAVIKNVVLPEENSENQEIVYDILLEEENFVCSNIKESLIEAR